MTQRFLAIRTQVLKLATLRRAFRGRLAALGNDQAWNFSHSALHASFVSRYTFQVQDSGAVNEADSGGLGDKGTALQLAVARAILNHLITLPTGDPIRDHEFVWYARLCKAYGEMTRYLADDLSDTAVRVAIIDLQRYLVSAFRICDRIDLPTGYGSKRELYDEIVDNLSSIINLEGLNELNNSGC